MNLASYQSHKIVKAGRIAALTLPHLHIEQADGSVAPYTADEKLFARYTPVVGDYLVEYEDGYLSISPAKAFEDGYRRL